jgi:hypothetical protein
MMAFTSDKSAFIETGDLAKIQWKLQTEPTLNCGQFLGRNRYAPKQLLVSFFKQGYVLHVRE